MRGKTEFFSLQKKPNKHCNTNWIHHKITIRTNRPFANTIQLYGKTALGRTGGSRLGEKLGSKRDGNASIMATAFRFDNWTLVMPDFDDTGSVAGDNFIPNEGIFFAND